MRSIEEPRPPLVARTHSAPEAVPPDDHASGVRAGAPADGSGQRALLLQRVAAHTFGMASPRGTVVECRGHASSARTFIYAKVAFDLAALAARACALEIVASATPTVIEPSRQWMSSSRRATTLPTRGPYVAPTTRIAYSRWPLPSRRYTERRAERRLLSSSARGRSARRHVRGRDTCCDARPVGTGSSIARHRRTRAGCS